MKATAEVQIIPIGSGVSVRAEVKRAHQLLESAGLTVELHANGTNLEGDLREIMDAVAHTIETLHSEGTVRLSTHLKLGTRTDRDASLDAKLF